MKDENEDIDKVVQLQDIEAKAEAGRYEIAKAMLIKLAVLITFVWLGFYFYNRIVKGKK